MAEWEEEAMEDRWEAPQVETVVLVAAEALKGTNSRRIKVLGRTPMEVED